MEPCARIFFVHLDRGTFDESPSVIGARAVVDHHLIERPTTAVLKGMLIRFFPPSLGPLLRCLPVPQTRPSVDMQDERTT
jgi:hypothetical protein